MGLHCQTRSSANAEGPREARVSRNPATIQNISLENSIVWHYLRDSTFSHFDTIPECDRLFEGIRYYTALDALTQDISARST